MFFNKSTLFLILISFSKFLFAETANTPSSVPLPQAIQYFQQTNGQFATCRNPNPNKTLLLIDATDDLSDAAKQFVLNNYIQQFENSNGWKERGDTFSIVILSNSPVAQMNSVTLCAPNSIQKDNGMINKGQVNNFKTTLERAFVDMTKPGGGSKNTNLVEAVAEVYRSATFKFADPGASRRLIIVSDLFQNSTNINFYQKCKSGCPSFQDSLKQDNALAKYLQMAKPSLSSKDMVEVYHLQSRCNLSESINKWWKGYFVSAGLPENNFIVKAELSGDCRKLPAKINN